LNPKPLKHKALQCQKPLWRLKNNSCAGRFFGLKFKFKQ
jgi:hypothetical protein